VRIDRLNTKKFLTPISEPSVIKILSIVVSCASIFLLSSCGGGSTGATGATGPAGSVSTAASATPNVLHSFQGGISDGSYPSGSLIQGSDGFFYGTSSSGGSNNTGMVFKVSTAGDVTVIYSFPSSSYSRSGVIKGSDGYLYGTSGGDGTYGYGTIYKLSTTGTLTTLYSFPNYNYAYSDGGVIQGSDGYLYGVISNNGANNYGSVYKISTTGTYTTLYSFAGGKSDGCYPYQGLKQGPDGYLYGVTTSCSTYSQGALFKISTAGVESILHAFAGGSDGSSSGAYQGGSPLVIASDGNLYGVNFSGGLYGSGTVYKLTTSGTFSTLYSFGNSGIGNPLTIIQGVDGNLYGSTSSGSYYSNAGNAYFTEPIGTIFKISTTGTFTSLYSFEYGLNGTTATSMIQASDGRFYGLSQGGGVYGLGTMFQF
jgi:uncharacterized repeat protein (TIGR03803 family)